MKCCLCHADIKARETNNPAPLVNERGAVCCDVCNVRYVIPARIEQEHKRQGGK